VGSRHTPRQRSRLSIAMPIAPASARPGLGCQGGVDAIRCNVGGPVSVAGVSPAVTVQVRGGRRASRRS
jgi:hypothetical protein